jgi:hypothetical protein
MPHAEDAKVAKQEKILMQHRRPSVWSLDGLCALCVRSSKFLSHLQGVTCKKLLRGQAAAAFTLN